MTGGWQSFRNRLYVLLFGAAVATLAWAWQFDSVPPDMAESLSVAAGLRPPSGTVSLLWLHVAGSLCRSLGVAAAETALRIAGHVSLGVLAVLSAALFRMLLPVSFMRGAHVASWWRGWERFVVFQGAALFCCSHPVWNAFRWFSSSALQTLLAVLAAIGVVAYFRTGRRPLLCAAFAVTGVLSADTPVGAMLLAGMAALLYVRWRLYGVGTAATKLENPLANALLPWRLTLSFAAGALAGAALEWYAFDAHGGFGVFGWSFGDYALEGAIGYFGAFASACTPVGVLAFLVVAACPALTEAGLLGRAADDERHLSYFDGAVFAACGLIAILQLAGASRLWFWTWAGEHGCVRDDVLKCVAAFLGSLAVMWAVAVFTIELYLRNFRRVATLKFQDAAESAGATEAFASVNRLQRVVRASFMFLPVVVLGCVVPYRMQRLERTMLGIVADASRETVRECGGARYLFTDGGLDAAVELAAAEAGTRLVALSMMGGIDDPREKHLRTRGTEDAEDKAILARGAADALRTWVRSRPDKSGSYAVQIGFELWQRSGLAMPECSGLVARPGGFPPEEAERGAEAGRSLARRVLDVYAMGDPESCVDRSLRDAFMFTQWRLAVLARHRANACDAKGKGAQAMEETRLADALDKKNGALAKIRATMAWASRRKLERMTAREGLGMSLNRADFALARVFALRILEVLPDDPSANFAVGMDFFVQGQYARAQAYLERCLEGRPNDPAVLNNIAQCRLRQGDPAGAMPYAERALEILPDSQEVRRTVERARSAVKGKAGNAALAHPNQL